MNDVPECRAALSLVFKRRERIAEALYWEVEVLNWSENWVITAKAKSMAKRKGNTQYKLFNGSESPDYFQIHNRRRSLTIVDVRERSSAIGQQSSTLVHDQLTDVDDRRRWIIVNGRGWLSKIVGYGVFDSGMCLSNIRKKFESERLIRFACSQLRMLQKSEGGTQKHQKCSKMLTETRTRPKTSKAVQRYQNMGVYARASLKTCNVSERVERALTGPKR